MLRISLNEICLALQIGRGFVLWEPHLEVSKVLLGLLEMCCAADWWVPTGVAQEGVGVAITALVPLDTQSWTAH